MLRDGHTTIVIAHRLSTVVNADCILVFAHGELVEQGPIAYGVEGSKGLGLKMICRLSLVWKCSPGPIRLTVPTSQGAFRRLYLIDMGCLG